MLTHKGFTVSVMSKEVGVTYCLYLEKKEKCTKLSKFDIGNARAIASVTAPPALPYCFNLDRD
jgi:hypothetical protein